MTTKVEFAEPATYLSVQKLRELDIVRSKEDIEDEISYGDVAELLDAKTSTDLLEIAERYAFFSNAQEGELAYDLGVSASENRKIANETLYINSIGYYDMRNHMETAIKLKELLGRKKIGAEDLVTVGFEIQDPPESRLKQSKEMGAALREAKGALGMMSHPMIAECTELRDRQLLPFFSLRLSVSYKEAPYAKHLLRNMFLVRESEGRDFAVEYSDIGFSFDPACDHFEESPSGYRKAVATALDTLIQINLADMAVTAKNGSITLRFFSQYAAFWYHLVRKLEEGRALRCKACGKPLITWGERGKKRLYCGDACRKWAQRHPGKRRNQR